MADDHDSHGTLKKANVELDKPKRTMRMLPGTGTKATAQNRPLPSHVFDGPGEKPKPRTN